MEINNNNSMFTYQCCEPNLSNSPTENTTQRTFKKLILIGLSPYKANICFEALDKNGSFDCKGCQPLGVVSMFAHVYSSKCMSDIEQVR